ncbi:MFS transporter [Streptomyces murinus]|uniref:MFS transporter n=1 Tax=Streptomyces murinus TaxID=33900 RepID=UPI0037FDC59B
MSVGAGMSAANTYYVQPLLDTLGHDFGVGSGIAGLVTTFAQVGYVLGLALIVPLGDLVERRRLVTITTAATGLGLLGMAAAPNIAVLMVLAAIVGFCTVTAQIFVPFAAHLATPVNRGRSVGIVMSGLLIGILLARTVSGVIAGATSWRVVYLVAAVLTFALSVACRMELPSSAPTTRTAYHRLLGSVARIYLDEPALRRRGLYGALVFASFSAFWTAIAFQMADQYHFSQTVIGLFGLLGVAGAGCAQVAGRIADAGWGRVATAGFILLTAVSWIAGWAGGSRIGWLVAGILVLDLGVQGTHISNQSEVYRLRPEARSRLTTGYMCTYFVGGVTGSALAGAVYGAYGWKGVCLLGAVFPTLALLVWLTEARWPLRTMARG